MLNVIICLIQLTPPLGRIMCVSSRLPWRNVWSQHYESVDLIFILYSLPLIFASNKLQVIALKELLWWLFVLLLYIIKRILFLLVVFLTLFQVTSDNSEEDISEGCSRQLIIWDMKQTMYMTIYTHVPKKMKEKLYFGDS